MSDEPKVWHSWTLPVPPSTNNLYANVPGKGRVKTARYSAWITVASALMMAAGPRPQLSGAYFMDVSLPPGLDLDNIKALGDLLQSMGIVGNDRLCWDLHVRRDNDEQCILRVREK